MATKITMRADAAALLIAKSYRWVCPQCEESNIEDCVIPVTMCEHCFQQCQVSTVFHANGRERVDPGVERNQITGVKRYADDPEINIASLDSISVIATAYAWVCAECDAWGERPQHISTCFTEIVSCSACGAEYEVVEVRHRVDEHLPSRAFLSHAVDFSKEDDEESEEKNVIAAAGSCPVVELDSVLGEV